LCGGAAWAGARVVVVFLVIEFGKHGKLLLKKHTPRLYAQSRSRALATEASNPGLLPETLSHDELHALLTPLSKRLIGLRRALLAETLATRREELREIFDAIDSCVCE
jgi:hypothetical protein